MGLRRIASIAFKLGVCAIVAIGFWFRISSLEAIPDHNADESYEGIQVGRLLRGEPFTLLTANGNLMNPFFIAMQAPFQLLFSPSLWVLRAPAVLSGVLTVLLTYRLGSRSFGRTSATIASLGLAAMPAAIVYSRYGFEYCQIPLVGVIAIHFAMRGRPVALALALAASLLIHPLNVFLIPVVLPVLATQLVIRHAGDWNRKRRLLIVASLAAVVVGSLLAWILLRRPVVRMTLARRPALDWLLFVQGLGKFLLFQYAATPGASLDLQGWFLWGLVVACLDLGLRSLVRERRWDRVALVAGLALSLACFHLLAGPRQMMDVATNRYGVVFLVPFVLAIACMAETSFRTRDGAGAQTRRTARDALLIAAGCGLLFCVKVNWFDAAMTSDRESIWTARTEVRDPFKQALSIIDSDARRLRRTRPGAESASILAQEYWDSQPLRYLTSSDRKLGVDQLITPEDIDVTTRGIEDRFAAKKPRVVDQLRRGGYVVALCGQVPERGGGLIEEAINGAYPPDQVRRWMIADRNYVPTIVVFRLRQPDDPPNWAPAKTASANGSARRR